MKATRREQEIIALLESRGELSVKDLSSILDVSLSTLRKQLAVMQDNGLVIRTYGGVMSVNRVPDETFESKLHKNITEKRRIAEKARSLVPSGAALALGSGTTVFGLANLLENMQQSMAGAERVLAVLDAPSEIRDREGAEPLGTAEGEITFTAHKVLVNRKLKMDLGDIQDLVPLERGKSGRIWKLQIVGSKRTFTIGKELEIRRTLSETHLYSSAFDVEKKNEEGGTRNEKTFVLHGKGWGHGVGLCQIGAAVMGEEGKSYDDILLYYYHNAEIKKIYE